MILWPYEETRFHFPDDETVRLSTPWRTREYFLSPKDKFELEHLVLRRDEVPAAQQRDHFSRLFGGTPYEPFFYLLARQDLRRADSPPVAAPSRHSEDIPRFLGRGLPDSLRARLREREWSLKPFLTHARLRGTEDFDPRSLLTILRRLHFLDAIRFDEENALEAALAGIKDVRASREAADLVAARRRGITRLQERLLRLAPIADPKERERALQSMEIDPDAPTLVNDLIGAFQSAGRESALALAAGLTWLDDGAHPRAAALVETHPPVAAADAHRAALLAETISRVLNHLAANLRFEIAQLSSKAS